jgi:small subunit ribosomal protein S5
MMKKNQKKDEFDSKMLGLSRVERMTGGGRRLRFQAVMAVGDHKGKVGVGVAKGPDVSAAIEKATKYAKKNTIIVPIVNKTIPHQVESKYSACRILLRPQKEGVGLVAGGTVRVICGLAGIQDISSKIMGRSGNKINNARATILALKQLHATPRITKQEN